VSEDTTYRIVTLGDSVLWGQGLLEEEKLDTLLCAQIRSSKGFAASIERVAHSGAVIRGGSDEAGPAPGEVPVPRWSIEEQCERFANAPDTVDLVLLNGGINDVGVATIVNPLALIPTLKSLVEHACYARMGALLKRVSVKFSKRSARILLVGYYPILSGKSDPNGVDSLLSMHGVHPPYAASQRDRIRSPIARCEEFFSDSTLYLQRAVQHASDPRLQFVPSGFSDDNALFTGASSLLWGIDLNGTLSPQDPMAAARRPLCDAAFGVTQLFHRETCYRASVGHPNVAGARALSGQLWAALAPQL
jgi:lysophospholipase L1-like esterase